MSPDGEREHCPTRGVQFALGELYGLVDFQASVPT